MGSFFRYLGNNHLMTFEQKIDKINELAAKGLGINVEEVRKLMTLISQIFRSHLITNGHDPRQITKLTTKLRDAGRRSPPWKVFSSRLPGRPQDGSDGNRTSRWLLEIGHKFHADEITATLVEIKYYLQCLSMSNAPALPNNSLRGSFSWLIEHNVQPGLYLDPIQKVPIDLIEVLADASTVQSGHLIPLDREGRHTPSNTYLMLKRSNALQGNLTASELLELMEMILRNHNRI
eukprot:gene4018-5748_t